MKTYKLLMNGQRFLLAVEKGTERHGFYQTFFIEASTTEEAEMIAVNKIRSDHDLRSAIRNSKEDPPLIVIEDIEEISEKPRDTLPETGRVWYSEEKEERKTSNQAL
ncbi:MAG: hypothetical protein WC291_02970 [Thermodesulfovibrionales bacterium]|jgi:SepF-like predicted cell division protein (DUF552 family)